VDSVVQRQPEDPAGLPPEVGTTIPAAQAELARAVQIANLTNDPLRHVLDSLSVSLGALHRLFVDGGQMIAQTMRQPIDQALIVDRLGSEAARAMDARADGRSLRSSSGRRFPPGLERAATDSRRNFRRSAVGSIPATIGIDRAIFDISRSKPLSA
jgi:hypothetical protein